MSDEHSRDSKLSGDNRRKMQERVSKLLEELPFNGRNGNGSGNGGGDVRVTVVGRDGFKVSMEVEKRVLLEKSRFFAEKIRGCESGVSHSVEISECESDDVEVYVEAVVLMYCGDVKKRLMGQGVSKVLSLLKVYIHVLCVSVFVLHVMHCTFI